MMIHMATAHTDPIDCIVLGGGPAGLQAALTLARVHRSVMLVDEGPGRNAAASAESASTGSRGIDLLPPASVVLEATF